MKNCNMIQKYCLKISALSSGKIDNHESVLLSGPSQIAEPSKFIYSPLVGTFESQANSLIPSKSN